MMKDLWRLSLAAACVLALGLFVAACDDGGGDTTDTPTVEATSEDGGGGATDTPEATEEEDGNGSAAADLPLPDGADEQSSLTASGTSLPFFVPSDAGVDASTYGEVTVKTYTVDGSPGDIIDFYKENQGDWEEAFAITTSEGGTLVWTREDARQAAWIIATEGDDAGTTSLTVANGRAK